MEEDEKEKAAAAAGSLKKSNKKKAGGQGKGGSCKMRRQLEIWNKTPLFLAAIHGHAESTEELIAAGCNVHIQDEDGWTPLGSPSTW